MKIYIAAASIEHERARRWIAAAMDGGLVVTCDWPTQIDRAGGVANPPGATHDERQQWAESCLDGVRVADVLWLLHPEEPSAGAWFEFGYAYASGLPCVVSGPALYRCIFCSLADARLPTDEGALEVLLQANRQREQERGNA